MEDKARENSNEKAKAGSGKGFNWFALLLAVIVGYSGWILADQQMTLGALDDDMTAARERLQAARTENQQLKDENTQLQDEAYIEKLAREELGMTRKGEMPYIYADNK
ncbi:MAG: septum formation initiator family protein [Selenomonadaceae bacterium]|nr:septum formation initiator family protein [Selenomonadaceae bacterium]